METMRMPFREIDDKFTKSEMVLMAWRSREVSSQMDSKINKGKKKDPFTDQKFTAADAIKHFMEQGVDHSTK